MSRLALPLACALGGDVLAREIGAAIGATCVVGFGCAGLALGFFFGKWVRERV